MNFAPISIKLLRPLERLGAVHAAGEHLSVPLDEAEALFRAGWAHPAAEPMKKPRPWWAGWSS